MAGWVGSTRLVVHSVRMRLNFLLGVRSMPQVNRLHRPHHPNVVALPLAEYHEASSSKATSWLTCTSRVLGLSHLYPFCAYEQLTSMHFSSFTSSFFLFSFGTCTYAMLPKTLMCLIFGLRLKYSSYGITCWETCPSGLWRKYRTESSG